MCRLGCKNTSRLWNKRKYGHFWLFACTLFVINFACFLYVGLLDAIPSSEVQPGLKLRPSYLNNNVRKSLSQTNFQKAPRTDFRSAPSKGIDSRLARYVEGKCAENVTLFPGENHVNFWLRRMYLVPDSNSFYCPAEKVGSTFWRRFLYQVQNSTHFRHVFDVPIHVALTAKLHKPNFVEDPEDFQEHFKFMFTRDPYRRLLSAYIDKMFAPNPLFWRRYGKPAIQYFRAKDDRRCFHDATFTEFLQFVTWSMNTRRKLDPHFIPITEMCIPCHMNYTFIGKMETFYNDVINVAARLAGNDTVAFLGRNMRTLANHDAIRDSIYSPFSWRDSVVTCMSWEEALRRMWRKLQLRGLVAFSEPFPGTVHSRTTFVSLAMAAYQRSDRSNLAKQKRHVYLEMYRSVPLHVLEDISITFQRDFYLFNYTDKPVELFDRGDVFKFVGVTELDRDHNINIDT